jgi:hypothetical protein
MVSFGVATKVKKINAKAQSKQFRNKLNWIRFANWIGITACCAAVVL